MSLSPDSLRELFFAQSIDGFFIMMLDEPIEWNDSVDKDAILEHVFQHQRMTIANEAYARQYRVQLPELIGKTPAEFFAHDMEAREGGLARDVRRGAYPHGDRRATHGRHAGSHRRPLPLRV